jgi:hypothetical protein
MHRFFVRRFAVLLMLGGLILIARSDVSAQQAAKGLGESQRNREKIGEVCGKPVYRDEIRPAADLEEQLHQLFLQPLKLQDSQAHLAEYEPKGAEIDAFVAYLKTQPSDEDRNERDLRRKLKEIETRLASDNLTERKRDRLESYKQLIEMKLREFPSRSHKPSWETFLSSEELAETAADKRAIEKALRDPDLSNEKRAELVGELHALETLDTPERVAARWILGNWKFERRLYDKFGGGRVLWQQAGLEAFDATRKWLESEERNGNLKITDPNLRTEFYHYWTRHHDFMLKDAEIRERFLEPEWTRTRG